MNIKSWIPIFSWLPTYRRDQLRGDMSAGLTVGVMLIPQGMAYAMIAGMPPIYGLYASIVPLILYAIFGTSRQLAVGPVAMVSLLVAAGVGQLAETGSDDFIALAIMLAFMVGLIQLGLGVFRLGFLVNFLSHPVISGFTSAAALIIGLSQLKHLLGVDIPRSNYIHEILIQAAGKLGAVSVPTLLIGLGGIATILLVKRSSKIIPGPLVAVVLGILVVWLGGLQDMGVKIVGEVPSGLPAFQLPAFDLQALGDLFPIALTISLVGFMESIAVAKAVQTRHKDYEVVANQELIGLGAANIGGAFFQAFPTTGGFSRTAVNDQAGAKTGMASIISAVLIAITLLFLTPLFYFLPKATLASVIMVAVFGLIDWKEAVHLWKAKRDDFFMLLATFVATLGLGIEEGILVGVALSIAMVIYRSSYPHIAVLGRVPGTTQYRNIERFPEVEQDKEVLIVRLDAQFYFANIQFLKDRLDRLIREQVPPPKALILDAAAINAIDSSAMHALEDWIKEYGSQKIDVLLSGVKGPVRDTLKRSGLMDRLGKERFFLRVHDAMGYLKGASEAQLHTEVATQSNVVPTHV
ncbi:MAG: solute carrier 26 family protein [Bacteroidetes bacterium]|nr:MAG: solute carrier 26 family protein [Bacteroidota bacterium]